MMNKKPFLYKLGVFLLKPLFLFFYNPSIKGFENIPQDEPLVIAGNHIHLYDQCHVLVSTKRYINYMAKLEYFTSKKTRWFFKSVGCIPVDRSKKDEHATKTALDILNKKGSIGIFPEGTRNALKKEDIKELYDKYFNNYNYKKFVKYVKACNPKKSQILLLEKLYIQKKINLKFLYEAINNPSILLKDKILSEQEYYDSYLLPFKFGAVSLASKTNSKIIPVVITGTYKFRSKNLVVNIGKTIEIIKDDYEKSNKILREQMINMIKEGIQYENRINERGNKRIKRKSTK